MALTPGSDVVPTTGTKVRSVQALLVQASLTLIPNTHRFIDIDSTSGDINLALPPGSAAIDGVKFFLRRVVSESDDVFLIPDGLNEINGVNRSIEIPVIDDFIEVCWNQVSTEWGITNRSAEAVYGFRTVVVRTLSDLPEASGGFITLEENVVYDWRNTVTSPDYLELNGAIVLGVSASIAIFIYTGSGAAMRSTGLSVNIQRCVVIAPGGDILECTGAAGKNVNIETLVTTNCQKIATINGPFDIVSMRRNQLTNASVSGISLVGAFDLISIRDSEFENNTLSNIDLSLVTSVDILNLINNDFNVISGASGVKNVVDSTNVNEFMRMEICNFRGAGNYIDTFTRCDPNVLFAGNIGNSGTEDSTPKAEMAIGKGDEAATTFPGSLGDDVSLNGTFTFDSAIACKFDLQGSNQIRYTGVMTITANIFYKMFIDSTGGTNDRYWSHVLYHHWNGSGYDAAVRIEASWDIVELDGSNPGKFVCGFEHILHTLDKLEPVVSPEDVTNNITAEAFIMTID